MPLIFVAKFLSGVCLKESGGYEDMSGLYFDCQVGTNGFKGRAHRNVAWLFKPWSSGSFYEKRFKDSLLFSESD